VLPLVFFDRYARHPWTFLLDAESTMKAEAETEIMRTRGIRALHHHLNRPDSILDNHLIHRMVLPIGASKEQPGADYWTGWNRRNILTLSVDSCPGDIVRLPNCHGIVASA
jgi:hypothetical protein